jgi:hypothetical protein
VVGAIAKAASASADPRTKVLLFMMSPIWLLLPAASFADRLLHFKQKHARATDACKMFR